jgi:tryptophan halogenase
MNENRIRRIAILGGGTAGWMTAAALSKVLGEQVQIGLVESDEIGIIGVGEATIPTIHWFNQLVGVNPGEFMRETRATFKLGIEFENWTRPGHVYLHPFGRFGDSNDSLPFHHRWIRGRLEGLNDGFEDYSLTTLAARAGRFAFPASDPASPLSTLGYAFHFDASLYAQYMRKHAQARGVRRSEGKVVRIDQHPETGFVTCLHTDKGDRLEADLFVDCSGLRGVLIEGVLRTGFDDWSNWLPCDRALAVPSERMVPPAPYTRSEARAAGWQWRIPLQHRTGNGYVYCSQFISDAEAAAALLGNLNGKPLADPRPIRFTTGRRKKSWNKNVVAVGLAGGFLEPLESTSIHLIQSAIAKLLSLFPTRACDPYTVEQFNRLMSQEFETVRDFLALHYHSTEGRDEPLWVYCRNMPLPQTLIYREEHFRRTGRIVLAPEELFKEASWFAVLTGQGHTPTDYNPLLDSVSSKENFEYLRRIKEILRATCQKLPSHESVIQQLIAAPQESGIKTTT